MVPGQRPSTPWTIVAASVLLALLLLYTLFAGYLPARQRIVQLEAELRGLYTREAELQTRLAQHERQLSTLAAERDALQRRVDALQRQLGRRR